MENIKKLFPNLPERLFGLEEIAENLWWSWHPAARMLYKRLNRQAWKESGHNPEKMLKEIPKEDLKSAANDPDYLRHYDVVLSKFRKETGKKGCDILDSSIDISRPIAYFSAEYGLHRSLRYAGRTPGGAARRGAPSRPRRPAWR